MRYLLSLSCLLIGACASSTDLIRVPYRVTDIPDEHRLELTYVNTFKSTVCLLPEFWPNPAGKFGGAPETFFLIAKEQRFAATTYNAGYCVARKAGDCSTVVRPGAQVSVSVSYEEFGLPESDAQEPKTVELPLKVYRCPA
jgi:hypothetical protein